MCRNSNHAKHRATREKKKNVSLLIAIETKQNNKSNVLIVVRESCARLCMMSVRCVSVRVINNGKDSRGRKRSQSEREREFLHDICF